MTRRDDFIARIARALIHGHAEMRHLLPLEEAEARATAIADALPGLFEDREITVAQKGDTT